MFPLYIVVKSYIMKHCNVCANATSDVAASDSLVCVSSVAYIFR